MEQRPLRVGDLVDDYCPRERRLTNHAIVAIVGDTIRQTRCTTCDADHPYKEARAPRPRKKDAPVAPAVNGSGLTPRAEPPAQMEAAPEPEPVRESPIATSHNANGHHAAPAPEPDSNDNGSVDRRDEFWPAHRTLIRATLPRTDNDPPTPRPIPEFTMHQRNVRGHHQFRPQGQGGNGSGWVDRSNGGAGRSGGGRPQRFGQGQGQGQGGSGNGNAPGQGQGPSGGGRPGGGRHRKSRRAR